MQYAVNSGNLIGAGNSETNGLLNCHSDQIGKPKGKNQNYGCTNSLLTKLLRPEAKEKSNALSK